MNPLKALAIAAASLALGLTLSPPGAIAQSTQLDRAQIHAAVEELAALMEQSYVFPEQARQYANTLRTHMGVGAYDGLSEPSALAARLQSDMRAVHQDAHLRVDLSQGPLPPGRVRMAAGEQMLSDDRWLAEGVGYFRINVLPAGEEPRRQMAALLDRYANANTLIIDLRDCRGGTLDAMDVLFSRLYARPTELLTMDTRAGANEDLDDYLTNASWLRRSANAPAGVTRYVHWATPTAPVNDLADARVYLLTDRTASACEHLTLAMKATSRATVVGMTTRGAGHYGGERTFSNGRLQVWLPVGRTYVAATGQDWEGEGIAPDRAVAAPEALNEVMRIERIAPVAPVAAPVASARVEEAAPRSRRYGLMLEAPQEGASYIDIVDTDDPSIARSAGFRAGDRIIAINGTAVSQLTPATFGQAMRNSPITMRVQRGAEQVELRMSLD